MVDKLLAFDTKLFLWLNGTHSPFCDKIMVFVSGKIEWVPLYIALLILLIIKHKRQSIFIILAIIIAVALADQIAVKAFKEVFHRLRPSHNAEIEHLVHIVNNYRGGAYGFVSNHAANSFALATSLALIYSKKWLSIAIFTWASVVSFSRIYLGVHYPGDILGGAILGIAISVLVFISYKQLHRIFITSKKASIN